MVTTSQSRPIPFTSDDYAAALEAVPRECRANRSIGLLTGTERAGRRLNNTDHRLRVVE